MLVVDGCRWWLWAAAGSKWWLQAAAGSREAGSGRWQRGSTSHQSSLSASKQASKQQKEKAKEERKQNRRERSKPASKSASLQSAVCHLSCWPHCQMNAKHAAWSTQGNHRHLGHLRSVTAKIHPGLQSDRTLYSVATGFLML